MSAYYSGVDKIRGKLKLSSVREEPLKPKKSAMDLFSRGRFFKPKKKAK